MSTVHDLASAMAEAFERKTRDAGAEYVILRDGSPEWMQEVCREAHGDMLPDDTRYQMIEAVVDAIAEGTPDGDVYEQVDALPEPVYYNEAAGWLSTYAAQRMDYADQAAEEYGFALSVDTWTRLAEGIAYEQREVFDLVVSALTRLAGED